MGLTRRAIFLALAVVAVFMAPLETRAQARKVVLLQYNVVPDPGDAPLWMVPYAMGYFAEEGLDVTEHLAGGSAGALQLLSAGQGEIGISTVDQLMVSIQQGLKVKSFFVHNRTYGSALVVPKKSGITTVEALKTYLKGNTIGVGSLSSGRINYAKAWLRDLGLQEDTDVKFVAVGAGAQAAAALNSGRVRGYVSYDAAYAMIESVSDIRFTRFETDWQGPLFSAAVVASEAAIQKDPEMVARFGRAVAKGLVFSTTNPQAVIQIYWKLHPETRPKAGQEEERIKEEVAVVQSMVPNWLYEMSKADAKWGFEPPTSWDQVQAFNFKAGVISREVPVSDYYTDRFVPEMNKFDPEPIRKQAREFTEASMKYTSSQ